MSHDVQRSGAFVGAFARSVLERHDQEGMTLSREFVAVHTEHTEHTEKEKGMNVI